MDATDEPDILHHGTETTAFLDDDDCYTGNQLSKTMGENYIEQAKGNVTNIRDNLREETKNIPNMEGIKDQATDIKKHLGEVSSKIADDIKSKISKKV